MNSFIAGVIISFLGSLPLGYLNAVAMYLSSLEGLKKAFSFAIGVVVIELIYLCGTVCLIDWLVLNREFYFILKIISFCFLVVLAIGSFYAAFKARYNISTPLIVTKINRFWLGIGMSALNPQQFVFWSGWLIYALKQSWFNFTFASIFFLNFGVGIGTILAMSLFIFAGHRFSEFMLMYKKAVHLLLGSFFLVLAVIQLF